MLKMEKQYRLLVLLFGVLLSISIVSAVQMTSPLNVEMNQNFPLNLIGSGFYAVELNIPSEFEIVSDPSGGTMSGGVYKTVTTNNLIITLRATKVGSYTLEGDYSSGDGVMPFIPKTISVTQPTTVSSGGGGGGSSRSCPVCPTSTLWSNCAEGKQIRYSYSCSSESNYQCVKSTDQQSCSLNQTSCNASWICVDDSQVGYQSGDCSVTSVKRCSLGCEDANCVVDPTVEQEDDLTIEILPEGEKNMIESMFTKILNFFKRLGDMIMFWN